MAIFSPPIPPSRWQGVLRGAVRLGVVFLLVWGAITGFDVLSDQLEQLETGKPTPVMNGFMLSLLFGYALLLAMPFVPGVEIGIAILINEGADAAPFVYLATVTGLTLAFLVGRYVALNWLIRISADLHLRKLCTLLVQVRDRAPDERITALDHRLPRWIAPLVLQYRYVTLAVLINIPGTIAIGGGGGILLAVGLSRLFHAGFTILTIALATLPVPLAVWLIGSDILH